MILSVELLKADHNNNWPPPYLDRFSAMKKSHTPIFNTALAEHKRRWPLKADYLDVPRVQAVSFIDEFGAIFGLECLRERSNFRHLVVLRTSAFDPLDLKEALEFIIDTINSTSHKTEQVATLAAHVEEYFGPLNGLMAVRLCGYPFVIAPKAALA
jgi:hypothetical protein